METDALEQEMNYPNPVERSDLPVKRRRWPRVLAAGLGLLLLIIVFLPQILSSRVGRKFAVSYIAGLTNSPVTIESVSTSWFGGTSIRHLTIKDPMGRRIGFKNLTCEASLWKLLNGRFDLGQCTIDELNVEYVIDDGRGRDTLDFMEGPTKGPAPAPSAGGGSKELPKISGNIKLDGGTLVLWRGTVQPKLFDVTWEKARFTDLKAEFDIKSLDQPWKYSLSATSAEDGVKQTGAIASSGTVDLGEGGRFEAGELAFDLTVDGSNVRAGPLGAVLIPTSNNQEIRQTFGDILPKLRVAAKAVEGEIDVQAFELSGDVARVMARATIDAAASPPTLVIAKADGQAASGPPVTITLGISKRAAANWFVHFNPFLREAVGGAGNVTVTIDSLQMPLAAKTWTTVAAAGSIKAQGVKLARLDEMRNDDAHPDNLASQLALLTGDSTDSVRFNAEGRFTAGEGDLKVEGMRTAIGPVTLVIGGKTDLASGAVEMTAKVATHSGDGAAKRLLDGLAGAQLSLPITGTVWTPRLAVQNPRGALSAEVAKLLSGQVDEQIAKLRAKEAQRQMAKSQQEIDDMLKPLRGMDQRHRAATQQNTTAPATAPK
jgi:hypothetical protein